MRKTILTVPLTNAFNPDSTFGGLVQLMDVYSDLLIIPAFQDGQNYATGKINPLKIVDGGLVAQPSQYPEADLWVVYSDL